MLIPRLHKALFVSCYFMTRVTIIYTILLLALALLTSIVMLASSHGLANMDSLLLVSNFSSLLIFPITGYLLFKFYNKKGILAKGKLIVTILFLSITGSILLYYVTDLLKTDPSSKIFYFTTLLFISTLFFLFNIVVFVLQKNSS